MSCWLVEAGVLLVAGGTSGAVPAGVITVLAGGFVTGAFFSSASSSAFRSGPVFRSFSG